MFDLAIKLLAIEAAILNVLFVVVLIRGYLFFRGLTND